MINTLPRSKTHYLAFFALFSVISILWSLSTGSLSISSSQLLAALRDQGSPLIHDVLFKLRLPRTLAAFVIGGLLAQAGALMQVLLRNPLADPYILGISSGSAASTLLFMLLGFTGYGLTAAAWLGSLGAMLLLVVLTQRLAFFDSQKMLLTGVALASGFSAVISFILLISPNNQLHNMLFWLVGDLSDAHMPIVESGILVLGLLLAFSLAKECNLLIRGEREAQALGVNTKRLLLFLYLLSALLTATAVALAGCVGFIGLIVPHMLRLSGISDHRLLLPSCVLVGGSLLTIADTIARTCLAPQQLPVGILIALLGIPVFLFLLREKHLCRN